MGTLLERWNLNEYLWFSNDMMSNLNSPKCISIIRYLSEAGDRVPLDTHSRIVQKLNFPQLIVELLDNQCPWIDGSTFIFKPKHFFGHRQQNHFQVLSINQENGKNVKKFWILIKSGCFYYYAKSCYQESLKNLYTRTSIMHFYKPSQTK